MQKKMRIFAVKKSQGLKKKVTVCIYEKNSLCIVAIAQFFVWRQCNRHNISRLRSVAVARLQWRYHPEKHRAAQFFDGEVRFVARHRGAS